ncbi:hypothetical protein CEXT_569341 [Caerostris extrusa]|uniref:Uncharacterized protein n=1 Tax=Caerostris extrusa TaxID=172846 RepID=A0AAV4SSU1_CAEEX|nr:hypothetical protein CEXT_569341 [Caerostris extrusa]
MILCPRQNKRIPFVITISDVPFARRIVSSFERYSRFNTAQQLHDSLKEKTTSHRSFEGSLAELFPFFFNKNRAKGLIKACECPFDVLIYSNDDLGWQKRKRW